MQPIIFILLPHVGTLTGSYAILGSANQLRTFPHDSHQCKMASLSSPFKLIRNNQKSRVYRFPAGDNSSDFWKYQTYS
jgi:hypothetical protein